MIVFDSERANDWRYSILRLAREFEDCEFRLNAVINGLDMEIAARSKIEARLDDLRRKARGLREGLESMADLLLIGEAAYTDADREIAEMCSRLTEEWQKSERKLAPLLSYSQLGLTAEETETISAIRILDGLFMGSSLVGHENRSAYFRPQNVKFTVLPDDVEN